MDPAPLSVRLRTQHAVWVRSIRTTDAAELQRAFGLLSDGSRYRRFLTRTPYLTDRQAAYFSDVDHLHHHALVALPGRKTNEIVGVARFIRYHDTPTDADLAITVDDAWQGRGLATVLLRLLGARARDVGVRRFTLDTLVENAPMLALVRSVGTVDESAIGRLISGHIDIDALMRT
jgi:acetyltransferase